MIQDRPFEILGIQQIAVGSADKQQLKHFWIDVMGLSMVGNFLSEKENVDEDICEIGVGPLKVEMDLMQPLNQEAKPKVHEPPLNHIGLWVDDLSNAVKCLEEAGVRFTPGGIRKGASGYDVCFIHPKGNDAFPIGACGVLVELVQAPPEVINAFAEQKARPSQEEY